MLSVIQQKPIIAANVFSKDSQNCCANNSAIKFKGNNQDGKDKFLHNAAFFFVLGLAGVCLGLAFLTANHGFGVNMHEYLPNKIANRIETGSEKYIKQLITGAVFGIIVAAIHKHFLIDRDN